jgi:hypothetical protein
MTHWWTRALATLLLVWPAADAFADQTPLQTDANLVTALDVSDSIMRHEQWLEFEGLAKAVSSAAFLEAVAGGRLGRIGFAVFTWSSDRLELLVPWTVLATTRDAQRIATTLKDAGAVDSSVTRSGAPERRTDISDALDFALELILTAPYRAGRSVINLCANGANVGSGPRAARDRALAAGSVVNALVIGRKRQLVSYFERQVRGGPGSFVMEVSRPENLAAALLEKLLRDLIAAGPR